MQYVRYNLQEEICVMPFSRCNFKDAISMIQLTRYNFQYEIFNIKFEWSNFQDTIHMMELNDTVCYKQFARFQFQNAFKKYYFAEAIGKIQLARCKMKRCIMKNVRCRVSC